MHYKNTTKTTIPCENSLAGLYSMLDTMSTPFLPIYKADNDELWERETEERFYRLIKPDFYV